MEWPAHLPLVGGEGVSIASREWKMLETVGQFGL